MSERLGAVASPARARVVDRWFGVGVALFVIVLNIVAFAPSLVDPSRRAAPLPVTPLVLVHAVVSVGWLLLFLAQTTLVATSQVATHRRVGVFGAGLSAAVVGLGVLVVMAQARRGFDLSGDIARLPLPTGVDGLSATVALLLFPVQFGMFVGAALWYRYRPRTHKRLMLFAALAGITPTPVAHLIGHWVGPQPWADALFPLSEIFFVSLIALHERATEGRIHPMTLWLGALVVALERVVILGVQRTMAWQAFAQWLVQ
ncbi:MAG: hypothetical protein U0Q12_24020 [Vicinamibacterales bacterium]